MNKNILKLFLVVAAVTLTLTACNNSATDINSSDSAPTDITTAAPQTEAPETTEEQTSAPETTIEQTSSPDAATEETSEALSTDESSDEDLYPERTFTIEDEISFTLLQGWKEEYLDIGVQFSNEYDDNTFNLVIGVPSFEPDTVTAEELTMLYASSMPNFKIMEFNPLELSGCKAVYVQFSGKLNQVDNDVTITMLKVQNTDKEYQFSFTQSVYDPAFQTIIDTVLKTLEIK